MSKFGVAYYGNRFMSHAREDLKKISECCDYIVHTVSENDMLYYKANLAKLFAETRRQGLEVWADPWGLGGVFGGEAMSKFLLDHRDSWQSMSDGRIVPSACLNRPEWRSYVKEWILTVRDMGAQVLFWDEPHMAFDFESEWHGIYACACNFCKQIYKKNTGLSLPAKLDDQARAFRRQTIRDFLNEVMAFSTSKGMRNALCLYAFKGHAEYDQIWREAAGLPGLDVFGCDPYWRWRGNHDPKSHVADFSRYVVEHAKANNKQSQVWIQAMRLPAGAEHEIGAAVEAAVTQGIDYIAAWGYDGGELLDTVLSERPDQVWRAVMESFKKHR